MSEQPHEVPETFAFTCGTCGHAWEAAFRLLFFTDPLSPTGGTTQEYVDEAGRAVRSPLADAVCPRCGGRRVRVLEAGLAERTARAEQEHGQGQGHGQEQNHGHGHGHGQEHDQEHPDGPRHRPPRPDHGPHHLPHPPHPHLPHLPHLPHRHHGDGPGSPDAPGPGDSPRRP